jgi:hypothetical protein
VISGRVVMTLGWRWAFWQLAITFGVVLLATVLFFPETSSVGKITYPGSGQSNDSIEGQAYTCSDTVPTDKSHVLGAKRAREEIRSGFNTMSFWKTFWGLDVFSSENWSTFLGAIVAPVRLLSQPVAIWGCLMWSVTFTWVIIQGSIAIQVWGIPPYNLSPSTIGDLIGVAPLIGSALGCLLGGIACDWLSHTMAKRNKDVYVPESRLLVIAPALLTCTAGAFGLGVSIQRGTSAITTAIFLAMLNFASASAVLE